MHASYVPSSLQLCMIYNNLMFMAPYILVMYVQLKVQLDVPFIRILFSSLFLALHVSGAICTHPQEHKLQLTAIGVCNGYGMLIHWSRYWLGHPHTFSTVLNV
jgi:hypothetical protein